MYSGRGESGGGGGGCLFVCLERALARIPTLRRPVEWNQVCQHLEGRANKNLLTSNSFKK